MSNKSSRCRFIQGVAAAGAAVGAAGGVSALSAQQTGRIRDFDHEAGIPNLDSAPWWALFAPSGTPRSIIERLSDALDKALDDDNTRKRLLELGGEIPDKEVRGPQALAGMVKSDIDRWAPIIKAVQ